MRKIKKLEVKDKRNAFREVAELKEENENLQQKYLSESYEKSKLVSENNHLLDVINNQDVKIADLEKKVGKLESKENFVGCVNAENMQLQQEVNIKEFHLNKTMEQLKQATELLRQWYQIGKKNHAPHCYGFVKDTEQFLKENE